MGIICVSEVQIWVMMENTWRKLDDATTLGQTKAEVADDEWLLLGRGKYRRCVEHT
jgi:hypothetical protein